MQALTLYASVLIAPLLLIVSACSSNNDADTSVTEADSANSSSAVQAQAFVNNGFYLSEVRSFGGDGSSLGGVSYELNADDNTIESRNALDESLVEVVYGYSETGDLVSTSFLSTSESLAPIDETFLQIDSVYVDGVLQESKVDYIAGNEEDNLTVFTYDVDGNLEAANTTYLETNDSEAALFDYENGLLNNISGNDRELPGATFTSTLERDASGRISTLRTTYSDLPQDTFVDPMIVTYQYDDNGNVSEKQLQREDGSVRLREVYTYQPTDEAVFNLINLSAYYSPQWF